jgi:hypothetical protein
LRAATFGWRPSPFCAYAHFPRYPRPHSAGFLHAAQSSVEPDLFFGSVIDGLDGFQLMPIPAGVRNVRMLAVGLGGSTAVVVTLFAVLGLEKGDAVWLLAAGIYLVLSVPADFVLWRVMQPPVLKSDGTTVSCKTGFKTTATPVADLDAIQLKQFPKQMRYVFAGAHGEDVFSVPEMWFRTEDMQAFAERIGIQFSGTTLPA